MTPLMQMNRRDILIGLVILAILAGIIYFVRRPQTPTLETVSTTPSPELEEQLESNFNFTIPDNVEKAQLKDVTGGTAEGIATRSFENGEFIHTVLVDLPDPVAGTFYEGWLVKADDTFFSTGALRIAKGGYLLEFDSSTDYSDYNKVVITLEKKNDKTPEKHILEGSF